MRSVSYTLFLWLSWVSIVRSARPLAHIERYGVVRPYRLSFRVIRNLSSKQVYPDEVQYALTINGENHTLHLERNRNLIGKDYTETHYSEDGSRVTTLPNYEDHCYYHGHIKGIEDSSVSVGICSGISGSVRLRQQVYLIEPLEDSPNGDHALYKQQHLRVNHSSCGLSKRDIFYYHKQDNDHDLTHNHTHYDHDQTPRVSSLFTSRLWKDPPISSPQRVVELFVVVDNTEYKLYGDQTRARMLATVHHIDKLYRPMNTRVMLVGLEIWTNNDLIDVDRDSDKTLDNFILWRKTDLLKRVKHDNAQFVTGIDFLNDTVGLAKVFTMCTKSSAGINQDHQVNYLGLATTMAHEIGHNLGMSHDSTSCKCGKSSYCVMSEKIRKGYPESFSSCSQEKFLDFLERAMPRCLLERPSSDRLYLGASCGNGFLDPGEECDCGILEECKNLCCEAATCRLTTGSLCAHGECCEKCQLKQAASMCRASASECDLTEYCTGISERCPDDDYQMNGTPCDHGQGYCYNGQCPTHQQHCRRLFGPVAEVAADLCFGLNSEGKQGANCGKTEGHYISCARQNLKCGYLFCASNEVPITGRHIVFTINGREQCSVAYDEDDTRNLDMVPTGTKCGPNKVCFENKCLDVSVYGVNEQCSNKCNNNGVCNHKKECHCNPGWVPPFCDVRYPDLPHGQSAVMVGILTALAALVLFTLVVGGLMRGKNYISRRKMHSTPGKINPMFKQGSVTGKPLNLTEISVPTLLETSATQPCEPLWVTLPPSRPPPQPPKKLQVEQCPTDNEPTRPLAPFKPLSPLNSRQYNASKLGPPPVPPVKPSGLPVPPGKPSDLPVPPLKPSGLPVPPVKPSGLPVPPVKPSGLPVPPVKPSGLPVPPVKPGGLPVPPLKPGGLPVPPVKPSGVPVLPLKPSGLPLPPVKPSGLPVPLVNSSQVPPVKASPQMPLVNTKAKHTQEIP